MEQLLLVGGLSPAGIRARLIEEGIVTRVSLATVERDIEAVLTRWRSKAVVSVTDAALRHLGRYRDLYQRALAVADSAPSPREVLSALALAGKFSDSEAKLLGAVTRNTGHDWLSNALEARERAEAAEAERERVLRHNQPRPPPPDALGKARYVPSHLWRGWRGAIDGGRSRRFGRFILQQPEKPFGWLIDPVRIFFD